MRSIADLSTKFLTTGIALALSMTCAVANTLSEIQVNAEQNGYGIVLKTDESAQMKKVVSSSDKMSIELKNVDVSDALNTVYNNVANIENVTIQPVSKSDIKVIFKGKDIAQSKVYFETVKTVAAPLVKETETLKLNGPVNSYTPVYHPEAFVQADESQTANPQLNEVLTKMHVTRNMLLSVKKYAKKAIHKAESSGINPIAALGVIIVAAAFALRPRGKSADTAKQRMAGVGLSAAKNQAGLEREIGLNREMAAGLNSLGARGAEPRGIASSAYGMKAYQQSQRNPYMTSNVASNGISGIPKRPLPKASAPVKRQPVQARPVSAASAPIQSQVRTRMSQPIQHTARAQAPLKESDLDSMKFLESITKIYEKNGRTDLAKGLKDNLKKVQTAQI